MQTWNTSGHAKYPVSCEWIGTTTHRRTEMDLFLNILIYMDAVQRLENLVHILQVWVSEIKSK